jgi:hypothetical protein
MAAPEAHHRDQPQVLVSPSSLPRADEVSTLPEVIEYGSGLVVSNDHDKEVWQRDGIEGNGTSATALQRPFWKMKWIWAAISALVIAGVIIGAVVGTRKLGHSSG